MAYPNQGELTEELDLRKEFYQLYVPSPPDNDFRKSKIVLQSKKYEPQTQQQFVSTFMTPTSGFKRLHLMHSTGCHVIGTPILMADNSIKLVDDLKIGDFIYGLDYRKEIVNIHSGTADLFELCPIFNDIPLYHYVVTGDHIIVSQDRMGIFAADAEKNGYLFSIKFVDKYRQYMVRKAGHGKYIGFTLKGSPYYVGPDGMILHNSGKTRSAIGTAQKFVEIYRELYWDIDFRHEDIVTPQVFILAFTGKRAFIDDLLADTSYGYITKEEQNKMAQLKAFENSSEEAKQEYRTFKTSIRMRLTSRIHQGYYVFYGYSEFVSQLFIEGISKLTEVIGKYSDMEPYEAVLLGISEGNITVNKSLMAKMKNSLIIADEIHNTYNSVSLNSRGIAIRYILDNEPSTYFMSLSATPINNSPTEIIDLANYLITDKLKVSDIFTSGKLRSDGLAKLSLALHGRISTVFDQNQDYYPERIDDGYKMSVNGEILKYLSFTPCKMSKYFTDTILSFYEKGKQNNDIIGIGPDSYMLFDMVLPNPDGPFGLYDSSATKIISSANSEWKEKNGISVSISSSENNAIYSGSFLKVPKLEKYSAKYNSLINQIGTAIKETGPCKMVVYHDRVHMSGVLMLQSIFLANGIIEWTSNTVGPEIRCAICYLRYKDHENIDHQFRPLRFATIYAELDKQIFDTIISRFQAANNLYGEQFSILLGSHVIRESLNLPAVRHLFLMSVPVSIPQLIQIFGRCIRRESHALLPEQDRNVHIHILINVSEFDLDQETIIVTKTLESPEVRKYQYNLQNYLVIQDIERQLALISVDARINKNIQTVPKIPNLGLLPFEAPEMPNGEIKLDTFYAYEYGIQEIEFVRSIIIRLFQLQPIYEKETLFNLIRSPPFGVNDNPKLISDASIEISLFLLISGKTIINNGIISGVLVPVQNGTIVLCPMKTINVSGLTKSIPVIDIESMLRQKIVSIPKVIQVNQEHIWDTFAEKTLETFDKAYAIYAKGAPNNMPAYDDHIVKWIIPARHFLMSFSVETQEYIAKKMSYDRNFREKYWIVYYLLKGLNVFVPFNYLKKYTSIFIRIEPKYAESLKDDDPAGILIGTVVYIYTGTESSWTTAPRFNINLHTMAKENDIVIGIYEQFDYEIKFKLRPPIQVLEKYKDSDNRKVPRGMVCKTMGKDILGTYLTQLSYGKDIFKGKAANLCSEIQVSLLTKELRENINSSSYNHKDLVKYIYGWWSISNKK